MSGSLVVVLRQHLLLPLPPSPLHPMGGALPPPTPPVHAESPAASSAASAANDAAPPLQDRLLPSRVVDPALIGFVGAGASIALPVEDGGRGKRQKRSSVVRVDLDERLLAADAGAGQSAEFDEDNVQEGMGSRTDDSHPSSPVPADLDVATRTDSMDEALSRAYAAFDELHQGDPKRLAMRGWLIEFERRRQQPDGGIRLELPDRRRDFVGTSRADSIRRAREAAHAAMQALLAVAWPPSKNAERQVRKQACKKRQKQQHVMTIEELEVAEAAARDECTRLFRMQQEDGTGVPDHELEIAQERVMAVALELQAVLARGMPCLRTLLSSDASRHCHFFYMDRGGWRGGGAPPPG